MQFTISMNSAENSTMRLFNTNLVRKLYALYGGTASNGEAQHLPDDFKLIVHDNLAYTKKNGETSLYWGLVPFFNVKEHTEYAITQFDLLAEEELQYDAQGNLMTERFTPSDEMHKFARETASPSITYKDWLDGIAAKFVGAKCTITLQTYYAKTLKGSLYVRYIWGISHIA